MDKLKWLQHIFLASIDNLLLIFGVVLLVLSFNPIKYQNKSFDFTLTTTPNWWLLGVSILLLIFFFGRLVKSKPTKTSLERLPEGCRLRIDTNHAIEVVAGEIQNMSSGGDHSAIVLPANTSFDDECIKDSRSALGAFCNTHFPSGLNEIQDLIKEKVTKVCGIDDGNFRAAPTGTTIMLEQPLGTSFRLFVTAITTIDPDTGISADTLSLISSIKSVFRLASQKRISHLYVPVMGTGHGGLNFKAALSLLLVQGIHCMQHEGTHHVRLLTIVVYNPDKNRKEQMSAVVESVNNIFGR